MPGGYLTLGLSLISSEKTLHEFTTKCTKRWIVDTSKHFTDQPMLGDMKVVALSDLDLLARNEAVELLPLTVSESHRAASAAHQACASFGADGLWPDLVAAGAYNSSSQLVRWPAVEHVSRAQTMALAAADAGPQAGNETLLRCADRALRSWSKLDLQDANWWYNDIGVPMELAAALLLMRHAQYPPEALGSLVAACSSCRTCLDRAVGGALSGANLVWLSHIAMQTALLRGNVTRVGECVGYIYDEVRFSPQGGEGMMVDGSFHQHGPQLLLGSYGASFAGTIAKIASHAATTRWALPADTLATLTTLLLDGDAWSTDAEGSSWDWSVVGRVVARKGHTGYTGYQPKVLRALGGPRAAELDAFARRIESRGNATASAAAPALLGHRAFYDSDYAVQRGERNGTRWALTVHLRSNRTIGAACVNGEGRPTEHASDGITAIYVAGSVGMWGAPNSSAPAFPALDWQRLPGLTAEVAPALLELCDRAQTLPPWRTSFVGSVSGGDGGLSAIDLWSHNLTAARSYFLSADGLLSLGARVHVASINPAITTLDVRRYDARVGGRVVLSAGAGAQQRLNVSTRPHVWRGGGRNETWWLWYDRVGYVVVDEPGGDGAAGTVSVTLTERRGDWSYMADGLAGTFTVPLLQIELADTVDGAFAYRVIPGVASPELMPALAAPAGRSWSVLRNTAQLQLVGHGAPTAAGGFGMKAVFWEAGEAAAGGAWPSVSVSAPCLLMLSSASPTGSVDVALSSPDNRGGPHLRVAIAGLAGGLDCGHSGAAADGAVIVVLLPTGDAMGNSTHVRCMRT